MSNNTNIEQEFFQNRFNDLITNIAPDHTILTNHTGELSSDVISKIESEVETAIIENGVGKSPMRKIFFISVETLQNMLIHGHKNAQGKQVNYFILNKNSANVEIISANLVKNSGVEGLKKQIEIINSFEDAAALKQFYMDHLENNTISEKGGAGLGFITIAMKSGNKLKGEFLQINDDYTLFELTSVVSLE